MSASITDLSHFLSSRRKIFLSSGCKTDEVHPGKFVSELNAIISGAILLDISDTIFSVYAVVPAVSVTSTLIPVFAVNASRTAFSSSGISYHTTILTVEPFNEDGISE